MSGSVTVLSAVWELVTVVVVLAVPAGIISTFAGVAVPLVNTLNPLTNLVIENDMFIPLLLR
jgi:hypothetical protein